MTTQKIAALRSLLALRPLTRSMIPAMKQPNPLLRQLRQAQPKSPRRVSSSLGYYKGAADHAFQLGVAQALKHAGARGQEHARLQAQIMGFNKQAGAMLGRLLGKGVNLAGKGLGRLGKFIGTQTAAMGKGVAQGMGKKRAPAWMTQAAKIMSRNPRTTGGVALGAGAGGLALANREPAPRMPSGQSIPPGFYPY